MSAPTGDRDLVGGTCLESSRVEAGISVVGCSTDSRECSPRSHPSFVQGRNANTSVYVWSVNLQAASDHPFRHNLVSSGSSRPDHQIAILHRPRLWNQTIIFSPFGTGLAEAVSFCRLSTSTLGSQLGLGPERTKCYRQEPSTEILDFPIRNPVLVLGSRRLSYPVCDESYSDKPLQF